MSESARSPTINVATSASVIRRFGRWELICSSVETRNLASISGHWAMGRFGGTSEVTPVGCVEPLPIARPK